MKITQEHRDYMQKAINSVLDKHPNIVKDYREGNFPRADRVKCLQERFCFDLMFAAGLTEWVCKNIYSYANDDHIYTALKSICPKI